VEEIKIELQKNLSNLSTIVVSIESGNLLAALHKYLKQNFPNLRVIGVIPPLSPISGKLKTGIDVGSYKMEGIGSQRMSDLFHQYFNGHNQLNNNDLISAHDGDAYNLARHLILKQGLLVGVSSGAVLFGALRACKSLKKEEKCLLIFNDSARSYCSTLLNEDWMKQNCFSETLLGLNEEDREEDEENKRSKRGKFIDKYRGAAVAELNLASPKAIDQDSSLNNALNIMDSNDFDFLPVVDNKKFVGFVSRNEILAHIPEETQDDQDKGDVIKVGEIMHRFAKRKESYHLITPETPLKDLEKFFEKHAVGFVTDNERIWCLGVVTKLDLTNYLTQRGADF